MSDSYSLRLSSTQQKILANSALFISDPAHIEYLTGYKALTYDEREGFAVITPTAAFFLLSSFSPYLTPPPAGLEIKRGAFGQNLSQILANFSPQQIKELWIDDETLNLKEYHVLQRLLPTELVIKIQEHDPIDEQRMIKDAHEISALRQANHLTHQAMAKTLTTLQVGETEIQVCHRFEQTVRKLGGAGLAFPTIVAFGPHTALPHHQPTDTQLAVNTPVLIDAGVKFDRYCGDVTRTIWFGDQPDPDFLHIEKVVTDAYQAATKVLSGHATATPAIMAADLDFAARDLITQAGFGPQFIHTTGHGVGLSIHESPSLNNRNHTPIQSGMVITIEPGIYLDNKFGYRWENSLLVENSGYQELI